MPDLGQSATSSAGGYCTLHGAYTGFICPVCHPTPATTIRQTNPYELTLQRIAVALERIAAALEKEA